MRHVIRIILAMFYGLTVVQSVASIPVLKEVTWGDKSLLYWVWVLIFGAIIFIVNGFWIEGYLVRRARIDVKAIGMSVLVKRGDIFREDGVSVIGVNDFFDTVVDDTHIANDSLHGVMIKKYWGGNCRDLDKQIENGLAGHPCDVVKRDGMAKEKRYPIGTSVMVKAPDGKRFVLVALTRTDAQTNRVQSILCDLIIAVRGALSCARETANGNTVSFPLMGTKNARIKAPEQALFNVLLSVIISESLESGKVSNQVNIILWGKALELMNLSSLEKEWQS